MPCTFNLPEHLRPHHELPLLSYILLPERHRESHISKVMEYCDNGPSVNNTSFIRALLISDIKYASSTCSCVSCNLTLLGVYFHCAEDVETDFWILTTGSNTGPEAQRYTSF